MLAYLKVKAFDEIDKALGAKKKGEKEKISQEHSFLREIRRWNASNRCSCLAVIPDSLLVRFYLTIKVPVMHALPEQYSDRYRAGAACLDAFSSSSTAAKRSMLSAIPSSMPEASIPSRSSTDW